LKGELLTSYFIGHIINRFKKNREPKPPVLKTCLGRTNL